MLENTFGKRIDDLSVVARQCTAALCLERYCVFHNLKHPDIVAVIDHIWGIGAIENPDQFVEWEQGFQGLKAAGWGDPVPNDLLEIIPPTIRKEYQELANYVIETSATTWYGS